MNPQQMNPGMPPQAPKMGSAPLDAAGVKAVKTAVQGAVDSVLALIQPGEITHDDVLDKVSAAVLALKKPGDMGGLGLGQGQQGMPLSDLQEAEVGPGENPSESEQGAGE